MKKDNQIKKYRYLTAKLENQQGATAVIVAIVITVLIAFAALAIDVGYLYATKNQLQNAADAASLAGAGELGNIYTSNSVEDFTTHKLTTPQKDAIIAVVTATANSNRATGVNIEIDNSDSSAKNIFIGQYSVSTRQFTETDIGANAVQVIGRRDSTVTAGMVSTFFANIFGTDAVPVRARATASMTGKSQAGEGELELPIGISQDWFNIHDPFCGSQIKFAPTTDPDACAGWNTWDNSPSNDDKERDILVCSRNDCTTDGLESPETIAGDTEFDFINGKLSKNTFDDMLRLFREKGYDAELVGVEYIPVEVDGDGNPVPGHLGDGYTGNNGTTQPLEDSEGNRLFYPDGVTPRNVHAWNTTVVVYGSDSCNPSGLIKIIGFTHIQLTEVLGPPNKKVIGEMDCGYIEGPSQGGGDFGVFGSVPDLVAVNSSTYSP